MRWRVFMPGLNQALEGKPADLTVGLQSAGVTSVQPGSRKAVTSRLPRCCFGSVNVDAFFLEYDNDRSGVSRRCALSRPSAGGPRADHQKGELENPQGVKARLAEAAQYVPLEQICLSPQCGFASTEEGNALSEDQQWQRSVW